MGETIASSSHCGGLSFENPWPGLEAYKESESSYFYGRETETRELLRAVQRELLTVLNGISGRGKSSLLQAGVFPLLRKQHWFPVLIHLRYDPYEPNTLMEQVFQAFDAGLRADGITVERGENLVEPMVTSRTIRRPAETLWEFLHSTDTYFWRRNKLVRPVLVFDQFEEIYTLGRARPDECKAFFDELVCLIGNWPPAHIEARMRREDCSAQFNLYGDDYRLVLCLRDEYLSDLLALQKRVPDILRNHQRLTAMTRDQALLAIRKAGQHLMAEDVPEAIVAFLSGVGCSTSGETDGLLSASEIDPALLSFACFEFNEKRKARGGRLITADIVQEAGKDLFLEFYRDCLKGRHPSVGVFIEERLLTEDGARNIAAKSDFLHVVGESIGTTEAEGTLEYLVNRRLIHIDERHSKPIIELTHDVLREHVKSCRDLRRQRQEEEDRASRMILIGLSDRLRQKPDYPDNGDWLLIEESARGLIKREPNGEPAVGGYETLANVKSDIKKYDEAEEHVTKAITICHERVRHAPADTSEHRKWMALLANAYARRAHICLNIPERCEQVRQDVEMAQAEYLKPVPWQDEEPEIREITEETEHILRDVCRASRLEFEPLLVSVTRSEASESDDTEGIRRLIPSFALSAKVRPRLPNNCGIGAQSGIDAGMSTFLQKPPEHLVTTAAGKPYRGMISMGLVELATGCGAVLKGILHILQGGLGAATKSLFILLIVGVFLAYSVARFLFSLVVGRPFSWLRMICMAHLSHDYQSAMWLAARHGFRWGLEHLERQGVAFDVVDAAEETPLMQAAMAGHEQAVAFLVTRVDVNAKDDVGMTALHYACRYNHIGVVALLLDHGADIEAENNFKQRPLSVAASYDRDRILKLLLERAAIVDAADCDGCTALSTAVHEGQDDSVDVLLKAGADVNFTSKDGWQPLMLAAMKGHVKVGKRLLAHGANWRAVKNDGGTALRIAVSNKQLAFVDMLLAHAGNEMSSKDLGKVLLSAATLGHLSLMTKLLQAGAPINYADKDGTQAIHFAAATGGETALQFLERRGGDIHAIDFARQTCLHYACMAGNAATAKWLAGHDLDMEAANAQGTRPLMLAAKAGNEALVAWLLEKNLDLEAREADGWNALMYACYGTSHEEPLDENHTRVVRMLLEAGADANAQGKSLTRPLAIACGIPGRQQAVLHLLAYKADVNARDVDGDTALHLAAAAGNVEVAEALIGAGSDVNAVNDNGYSPLALAAAQANIELLRMLVRHGACKSSGKLNGMPPVAAASNAAAWESVGELLSLEQLDETTLRSYAEGATGPEDACIAHVVLGDWFRHHDRKEAAFDWYRRARELARASRMEENLVLLFILEHMQNLALLRKQFEEALSLVDEMMILLENGKIRHASREMLAGCISGRAYILLLLGRLKEAFGAAMRAYELCPSDPNINLNMGHALLYNGQADMAVKHYRFAASKGGDWHEGKPGTCALCDDFRDLREAGRGHPTMEKIERLLTSSVATEDTEELEA